MRASPVMRARLRLVGLLVAGLTLSPGAARAQEPPQAPILRVEAGAHTAPVSRLATDAAGRLLASVADDKTLRLWALPEGTPMGVLRPPNVDRLKHLAVSVTVEPRLFLGFLQGSLARGHLFQGLGQLL